MAPNESDLVLLDILYPAEGSLLFRIATVISRIEDLSHILVWASPSMGAGDQPVISMVELPRLKLRFKPQMDLDGAVRMHLQDHPGWFISEAFVADAPEPAPRSIKFVEQQLQGVPNCVLLQNASHELRVLVANHEVKRPRLPGEPFSTLLLFDRTSEAWKGTFMDTRCYFYDVHASISCCYPHRLIRRSI